MFNDEWIEDPTPEEAAEIDRHNRGLDAVEKGMVVLLGMVALGLAAASGWHHLGL